MKVSRPIDQDNRRTQNNITESLRLKVVFQHSIDHNSAIPSNSTLLSSKPNQLKMPLLITRTNNFQEQTNFDLQSPNIHKRAKSKQSDDLISSYILDLNNKGEQKNDNSFFKQRSSQIRYSSQIRRNYDQDPQFSTINKSSKKESDMSWRKSSISSSNQSKQIISYQKSSTQNQQLPKIQICQIVLEHIYKKFRLIALVIGRIIRLYKFVKKAKIRSKPSSSIYQGISTMDTKTDLKQSVSSVQGGKENLNKIYRKWVEPALQKIFYYFKSTLAFQSKNADSQDQRELWTGNLMKFLLQNLELITRKGNIPKQIIQEMSKCLLKENQNKVSLYVAQRTNFFLFNMKKQENQLIASEFIFFEVFIRQFLEISNEIKYQSFVHKIECKIKAIELVSLMQIFFMKYFERMPLKENKSDIQLFQRILSISTDDDQNITINESLIIDDSAILILGLKNSDHFKQLLNRKHKWKQNMSILFDKTIQNIYSQLEIDFQAL